MKSKPEISDALRAAAASRFADPAERQRAAERCRSLGQREDVKIQRSNNAKKQWADFGRREQRSLAYREKWQDPEYKAAVLAKRRATIEAKRLETISCSMNS